MATFWHEAADAAQARFLDWWNRRGPAISIFAPKDEPWEPFEAPPPPVSPDQLYADVEHRALRQVHWLSTIWTGGTALPFFNTSLGPGSLGLMLGQEPRFAWDTVWFPPLTSEPEDWPELRFDPGNPWYRKHVELIARGRELNGGRYLIAMPDLIENLDTVAQMRDPQTCMEDLLDRPEWVKQKISEVNRVYFEAADALAAQMDNPIHGTAHNSFHVWGPGRTAKTQCDAAAMISPAMFREFVVPALTEQCEWLDHSMHHVDGTQALYSVDILLEIEALDAVEWTPQAGIPMGGDPCWYDLYRRILAAGKSVQAVAVDPSEVLPLLDACGSEGVYAMVWCKDETEARALCRSVYGTDA